MKSINDIQAEIAENFQLFEDDMEGRLMYLMDLGNKLPPMPDAHKTDEFIVKGCQSKVWVYPTFQNGRIHFEADSNTAITKGLVCLLVQVWNDRTPDEILHSELNFIEQIGMSRMIGSQRSNGFAEMIRQMRRFASIYQHSQHE